jgi:patatin-like phospholipase/acyl hydrolase
VDGGVVANNPSMAAVAQALDGRAAGTPLDELVLLSLGSGSEPMYIERGDVDWGWAQWARPLVSMMISGVMGVADFQSRQLLGDRYFRLDHRFDRAVEVDDRREATLSFLVAAAEQVDLRPVERWLQAHHW